jgi:hypothetical protein
MTKKERHAEWTRQIREIKALGREQVIAMYRAYFPDREIGGHTSTAWLASSLASYNMRGIA